jgi:hypothetical protein
MKGLDPKPIPPQGSKIVGQHEDGRPIYELREKTQIGKRIKKVNGEEVWKKHQTTGEPMYPVYERIMGEKVRVFVLEPQHNGNVLINENFQQNAEDKAREEERNRIAAFQSELAAAAIKRGLSAEDVLEQLAQLTA